MTKTIKKGSLDVVPHARFDTRAELTSRAGEGFRRNDADLSGLAELLFGIPGIRALHVEPYTLRIYKAECFAWDEICPQVAKILEGIEAVKP